MIKVLAIAAIIAATLLSQNRIEVVEEGSTEPTYSTRLSANAASDNQLRALEIEGY